MNLFVDSSAWYALSDYDDKHHDSASIFLSQVLRSNNCLITSNLVIGETYTLLRARLGHREAWEFLSRVKASPYLNNIFINEVMESKAYNLLKKIMIKVSVTLMELPLFLCKKKNLQKHLLMISIF